MTPITPFEIFRSPISILRLTPGSYVDGKWVEGTSSTIAATASLQPVSGQEIMFLPESRRERIDYKMYTSTPINDLTTANPDQIQFSVGGSLQTFEVFQIFTWQNNDLFYNVNHYKYFCMRLLPLP
jgi:hypothetical protein